MFPWTATPRLPPRTGASAGGRRDDLAGIAAGAGAALPRLLVPVVCLFAAARPLSPDAQDLVQDFLAHLIERRAFREVTPDKGRFRSFLITCLNHFVADAADRDRAQKRGGGGALLSLHAGQADQLYQLEAKTS